MLRAAKDKLSEGQSVETFLYSSGYDDLLPVNMSWNICSVRDWFLQVCHMIDAPGEYCQCHIDT
jgi:hypothetical protein